VLEACSSWQSRPEPRTFGRRRRANAHDRRRRSWRPIVSEARSTEHLVVPAHQRLKELSANLWWSWDDESTSLFASSTR
jgi:hypothetical protein